VQTNLIFVPRLPFLFFLIFFFFTRQVTLAPGGPWGSGPPVPVSEIAGSVGALVSAVIVALRAP
jgi:hypothetical protein